MSEEIVICSDIGELSKKGASLFIETGKSYIKSNKKFNVLLSGGRTPEGLYKLLGNEEFKESIDWKSVHFFWGDERCVGPDHEESNFRMCNANLISKIEIPSGNIHRIPGEKGSDGAGIYERDITGILGDKPVFDLVLLGMGEDGHIASLFPGSIALSTEKNLVSYIKNDNGKLPRITITPPIIIDANNIVVMVSGERKGAMIRKVIKGDYEPKLYPAQIVRNCKGKVIWLLDKEVAAFL